MKFAYAVAAVAAAFALSPAGAVPVTFTLTGTMDGSVGTGGFINAPFTIVGTGDTAALNHPLAVVAVVPLTSVKITYNVFGPQTLTVTDAMSFFSNHFNAIAGFSDDTRFIDTIEFTAPVFATYEGVTPLGPLTVTPGFLGSVGTSGGDFTFSRVSGLTFSAVTAGAVPEPGTVLLFGAGLWGLGRLVRRRLTGGGLV